MNPLTMTQESAPEIIGWHFASDKLRDDRPLPKKGETLTHTGDVVACPDDDDLIRGAGGLHASVRALDALKHAPGFRVARVRLSGTVVAHGSPVDKHAASERTNLTDYVDARAVVVAWAFAVADHAVRVDAVAALRAAAGVESMPRAKRKSLLAAAESLEKLPTIDSRTAAWAARDAAVAAASTAAWAARVAAGATRASASNDDLERRLLELMEVSDGS